MTDKAIEVNETRVDGAGSGGGIRWYKPYAEVKKGDFKILWPNKENFKDHELQAMIRLFGTGFIIVDEEGNELRRMP